MAAPGEKESGRGIEKPNLLRSLDGETVEACADDPPTSAPGGTAAGRCLPSLLPQEGGEEASDTSTAFQCAERAEAAEREG